MIEMKVYKITDFVKTDIPKYDLFDYEKNGPVIDYPIDDCFYVSEYENELLIEIKPYLYSDEYKLEVPGGVLIGIDRGEFIGGLFYFPGGEYKEFVEEYGIFSAPSILHDNVRALFKHGDRFFALSGLCHLGSDRGDMWEIVFEDGTYTAKHLISLEGCHEAYTIVADTIFVSTREKILQIDLNLGRVERKIRKPNIYACTHKASSPNKGFTKWQSMGVMSVVVISWEEIYLGLRGGLLKINLLNEAMTFYRKK